ncbi:MAG: tRNA (guanosine(46)-N7)-methyltransferase TrmB [Paludibacteraceae bacterium]|nr:tRNA (guanosine(46)-N7)-methyltransferase TrmB [Paludibacteraceae bacterium]
MGKNKLFKFREMETFPHVFQYSFDELQNMNGFTLKGKWNNIFFKNTNPIVVELGCGKGEYTVGLAKRYPNKNFIGIDIKGARIWTGAKESFQNDMKNVAFLRTGINLLHHFFAENEVAEIWITFPDPQMKKTRKRLTSSAFLALYKQILQPNGIIHLKTDSNFMYTYTKAIVEENKYKIFTATENLYNDFPKDDILSIKTFYEQQWLARGLDIKYLKFQINNTENIIEPDIDIEHDSYRSFGRNQRSQLNKSNE